MEISFVNTFEPVVPLYRDVASCLKESGYSTSAIVSKGNYRQEGEIKDFDIRWDYVWVPPFLKSNKRWCAVFFWILAPLQLCFPRKCVHVFLTQPPLFFILGATLSRISKTPYIIHVMDLYPEMLAQVGLLDRKNYFYKLLSKLAVWAFRGAQQVFVIGRCMKKRLIKQGVDPSSISIVSNWASNRIRPVSTQHNQFRSLYQLQDKFIVMYSGNMGVPHELKTILRVARHLEAHKDIVFVFIGEGVKRKYVKQAIDDGAENVLLFHSQPEEMIAHSLSAADVHFLSLKTGFEGLVVPSKFYGILASGKPVIYEGGVDGEAAQVIEEEECGVIITEGDSDGLEKHILQLYEDKGKSDTMGKRSLDAYRRNFQGPISSKEYSRLLIKAVGGIWVCEN